MQIQNDRMNSVPFQGKPFSIIVIQVYEPTTNGGEAQGEFYIYLDDLIKSLAKIVFF